MSAYTWELEHPGLGRAPRRVRHLARESLAVMAFSAFTSAGLALGLLLLTSVAR